MPFADGAGLQASEATGVLQVLAHLHLRLMATRHESRVLLERQACDLEEGSVWPQGTTGFHGQHDCVETRESGSIKV